MSYISPNFRLFRLSNSYIHITFFPFHSFVFSCSCTQCGNSGLLRSAEQSYPVSALLRPTLPRSSLTTHSEFSQHSHNDTGNRLKGSNRRRLASPSNQSFISRFTHLVPFPYRFFTVTADCHTSQRLYKSARSGRTSRVVSDLHLPPPTSHRSCCFRFRFLSPPHRFRIHEQKNSKVLNGQIRYDKQTEVLTHATHVGTSRLHKLHESKLPCVSRIAFIRSKLSNVSAYVSGVTDFCSCALLVGSEVGAHYGPLWCRCADRRQIAAGEARPADWDRWGNIPTARLSTPPTQTDRRTALRPSDPRRGWICG